MSNILIKNVNLNQDITIAKKIIEGRIIPNLSTFDDHSMIYRTSTENMTHKPFLDALQDKKRVLSITGSADQIINSVLFGGKDIVGLDICRFSKYFAALKIAALESLEKKEYFDFILGNVQTRPLDISLYSKVRDNLVTDALKFWDSIINTYNSETIDESPLFGYFNISRSRMTTHNPYLQDNNYDAVRDKLQNATISLMDSDIFDIDKLNLGNFDLIMLSNVINYLNDNFVITDTDIKNYKKFVKSLPLNPNGVAITYNFSMDEGFVGDKFNGRGFSSYKVNEELPDITIENEIIVYTKKKKII